MTFYWRVFFAIEDAGSSFGIAVRPQHFRFDAEKVGNDLFVDAVGAGPDVAEAARITATANGQLFERHPAFMDFAKDPLRGPDDGFTQEITPDDRRMRQHPPFIGGSGTDADRNNGLLKIGIAHLC